VIQLANRIATALGLPSGLGAEHQLRVIMSSAVIQGSIGACLSSGADVLAVALESLRAGDTRLGIDESYVVGVIDRRKPHSVLAKTGSSCR
jgi:hypothetical protein